MLTIFGRICNAIAQLFAAREADIDPANSIDALTFQLLTAALRWNQNTLEAWLEILGNTDWAMLTAQEYRVFDAGAEQDEPFPVMLTGTSDQWINLPP